jgi:Ca2+:H+ antiporter
MATVLENNTLHLLLVLLPFALIAAPLNWPPVVQFILSFLSIIPLSSLIDYTTEDLSLKLGQTLGELTSAAFENAVEIAVSKSPTSFQS